MATRRAGNRGRARRASGSAGAAVVALVVVASLTAVTTAPAASAATTATGAGSPVASGGSQDAASLAAQESAVLMQIAQLSDRVDRVQASLVGTELAHTAAVSQYRRTRAAVVGMVVQAYMRDQPVGGAPGGAPAPFVDVAASAAGRLVARYAAESRSFASAEASYDRSLTGLHADQARLQAQQQALDVLVSAAAAAAERRRSADAAALAASDEARHQADTGGSGGSGHAAATAAQAALMARYPFGPLPAQPDGALPASLKEVGPPMTGVASWYGPGFDGQPTASGAIYDENGWTVASPDLPLGTLLVVSSEGRSVLLLVNDRGPYVAGRILDLSHAGAEALGFDGLATVTAQVVVPVT